MLIIPFGYILTRKNIVLCDCESRSCGGKSGAKANH